MSSPPRRIGVIYPSNGVYESEFVRFTPPEVTLHFTRFLWPQPEWFRPHWPDQLARLAHDPDIAACTERFSAIDPAVVTYACTSVSFAAGAGGDHPILHAITQAGTAVPSSTATAFAAACAALRLRRVAVASVYRADVTARFVAFLAAAGVDTVAHRSAGWERQPDDQHRLTTTDVCDMAAACDHPSAQAVLIPETNIDTSTAVPLAEATLGKPVLSAIQVTVWHAARLAGSRWSSGIGALWQYPTPGSTHASVSPSSTGKAC